MTSGWVVVVYVVVVVVVVLVLVLVVLVKEVVKEVVDLVRSSPSVGGLMERRQEKTAIAVAMKMRVRTSSANALQPIRYFICFFFDSACSPCKTDRQ
jgi:predicted PurR-regulated permease PerM